MDNENPQRKRLLRILLAVTSLAVLCVAAAVVLAVLNFGAPNNGGADDGHLETIIKDNVVIYDEEASPFKILASDETSVTVSDLAGINEDSILSAGVTEATPYGLLRRINSIMPTDDGYVIATEQAALTDAIEQCDIEFSVVIDEAGDYQIALLNEPEEPTIVEQAYAADFAVGTMYKEKVEGTPFSVSAGIELGGHLVVDANPFAENLIDFELTLHPKAELSIDDLFNLEDKTKTIWEKALAKIPIPVGPLAVVLVPEISLDLSMNGEMGAGVAPFLSAALDKTVGFRYTSSNGLEPIDIDNSKWGDTLAIEQAKFGVELDFSAGLLIYDAAGPELSAGIAADLTTSMAVVPEAENVEIAFEAPWSSGQKFSGYCDFKVYVPLSGHFVVQLPNPFNIFDGSEYKLEAELFNTDDAITLIDVSLGTPPDELSEADESTSTPAGTGDESTGSLQTLPDGRIAYTTPRSSTVPQFRFECPAGWTASGMVHPTGEDMSDEALSITTNMGVMGFYDEGTVLATANGQDGAVVTFFCERLRADRSIRDDVSVDATEVAQTGEIATSGASGSGFDSWAVANIAFLNPVTGSEEQRFQLVPKSIIGSISNDVIVDVRRDSFVLTGAVYEGCLLGFYAENIDQLNPKQRGEIISILSSLRVVG